LRVLRVASRRRRRRRRRSHRIGEKILGFRLGSGGKLGRRRREKHRRRRRDKNGCSQMGRERPSRESTLGQAAYLVWPIPCNFKERQGRIEIPELSQKKRIEIPEKLII
jgi:hypothetical protein